jgi:hypothetical protein
MPTIPWHHSYLASAYALKGVTEPAAAELAEARRLRGEGSYSSIVPVSSPRRKPRPTLCALADDPAAPPEDAHHLGQPALLMGVAVVRVETEQVPNVHSRDLVGQAVKGSPQRQLPAVVASATQVPRP